MTSAVQQAEHFLDRALSAAAHGHIAATARLAANGVQHFQRTELAELTDAPAGRMDASDGAEPRKFDHRLQNARLRTGEHP
jgi:hypothetical protein